MSRPVIPAVIIALLAASAMIYLGYVPRPSEPGKTFAADQVPPPWRKDVVEAVERVAIADSSGRIKSLYTLAHYELLQMRAYAGLTLKIEGEEKKRSWSPGEWLLDCLFFPELANQYPIFIVENREVLAHLGIGIAGHDPRRDRYSYDEIAPAREAMIAAARRVEGRKPEEVTLLETQTGQLAHNLLDYEALTGALEFARKKVAIPAGITDETLQPFAGQSISTAQAIVALTTGRTWQELLARRGTGQSDVPEWVGTLLKEIDANTGSGSQLVFPVWYPPTGEGKRDWASHLTLTRDLTEDGPRKSDAAKYLTQIAELTTLAADRAQNAAFQDKLLSFTADLTACAGQAGAYGKTALDRAYLKTHLLWWAQLFFPCVFLITAASWLSSGRAGRILTLMSKIGLWIGLAAIVTAIGWRVLVTGWGPVTTIYETIPYITLMGALFALAMSFVLKNRIPHAVAVIVGMAGTFLAGRYEAGQSQDTITALQPVLRSNYWLWTHVTTINLGYATVMIAAIFSMVYIFARAFDLMRRDHALFRGLTRCVYGILCFGLFFSLIGTVLGGIWGNDSWGRFWGWDPKENGALLIVIWCLMVLHMRLASWIKEFGLHIWCTLGAMPCVFSWWHVNLLGVGLHSYGFTAGLVEKLYIAYGIIGLIAVLGWVLSILEKTARRQTRAEPPLVTAPGAEAAA